MGQAVATPNDDATREVTEKETEDKKLIQELYHHRMILSALAVKHEETAWKSFLHSDGSMFTGMFIMGWTTPEGNYTFHYYARDWDKFHCRVLPEAPEWDGHTGADIEKRLMSLIELE